MSAIRYIAYAAGIIHRCTDNTVNIYKFDVRDWMRARETFVQRVIMIQKEQISVSKSECFLFIGDTYAIRGQLYTYIYIYIYIYTGPV
jgi:hypothetical protein